MTPVFDAPELVKAFVASKLLRSGRHFGESTAIGLATAENGLVAGVVYHDYEPEYGVIEITAFSARRDWLSRRFLGIIFDYPFDDLRCRIVKARTSENNKHVVRIWGALGAENISIPNYRAPGENEIVSLLSAGAWQKFKRRL